MSLERIGERKRCGCVMLGSSFTSTSCSWHGTAKTAEELMRGTPDSGRLMMRNNLHLNSEPYDVVVSIKGACSIMLAPCGCRFLLQNDSMCVDQVCEHHRTRTWDTIPILDDRVQRRAISMPTPWCADCRHVWIAVNRAPDPDIISFEIQFTEWCSAH